MYQLFFQKLKEKISISPAEEEIIKSNLIPKKLRKKQYLLQEGDICKTIAFVEKGTLRKYNVDEKGSEHILQFALEGWTVSDLYSFMTNEPSIYNIDALEDSDLVLISQTAQEEIIKRVPQYETYLRLMITGAYIALQRRLTSIMSMTIEERYTYFTELYPDIVQRVPQHMIASYMGFKPETLSRARRKIAENK